MILRNANASPRWIFPLPRFPKLEAYKKRDGFYTHPAFLLPGEKVLFEQGHLAVQDLIASAEAIEIRAGAEV